MARGRRKRIIQSHNEYLSEEVVGQKCNQKSVTSSALYPCTEEDQLASENENEELAPEETEEVTRRGKTKLKHVWNIPKGHRIVVNCNELDQPVGEEARVLGKFLGMIARNGCLCSLSFKDWRLLIGKKERSTNEQKNKEDILKQVKKRFLYPARMEKWVLRTIGEKWRQHKSNLKSMYFVPHKSNEANISNIPEGVIADQWIALVNNWMTPKTQGCLDDPRSMQIDVQTTSKRKRVYGATRSEEFELHNIQDSTRRKVPNDRDGNLLRANRVPTPYKGVNQETTFINSSNEESRYQAKIKKFHADTGLDNIKCTNASKGMNQETSSNFSTHEEYIYQRGTAKNASHNSILVGTHVYIKSWANPNRKVALGTILGKDPKCKVGGVQIGTEFWMVRIGLVSVPDEPLVRLYNNFKKMGDIGSNPIAWPSRFIEKVD